MRRQGSYWSLCWGMTSWILRYRASAVVVRAVGSVMRFGVLAVLLPLPFSLELLMGLVVGTDDVGPFIGMPAFKPGEEVELLREAARWADDI
jgi:hypothetical protein